jgi:hypothetical protein
MFFQHLSSLPFVFHDLKVENVTRGRIVLRPPNVERKDINLFIEIIDSSFSMITLDTYSFIQLSENTKISIGSSHFDSV